MVADLNSPARYADAISSDAARRPSPRPRTSQRVRIVQNAASSEYFRNAVLTASPEQLQLMLYDGAIRFTRQARDAMQKNDLSTSCEKLIRAQRIVLEMDAGLKRDVNPELCAQLAALYRFVYQRLVDANMRRDLAALDESLQILEHQRETWRLLVEKVSADREVSSDSAWAGASAQV